MAGVETAATVIGVVLSVVALMISLLTFGTSKTSARAAEESAKTARDAVEHQRREMLLARKACLALARDKNVGGFVFSADEENATTLKVFVRNEGKESAYNIVPALTFDGKNRTNRWSRQLAIAPGEVQEIEFYFPFQMREYDDMPFDSQAYFEFRADYRDGVGSDAVIVRFRFEEANDPREEEGFPRWNTITYPEDTQRSELCRPLAVS